jgi:hypothetical protein
LFKRTSSWVAPQDIQRVSPNTTDSEVAVQQVQQLDKQNDRLKVVVADSLYGNQYFLAVFLVVTTVVGLVRLRSNLRLYENPLPKPPKSKGRPRVHGPVLKLTNPARPADRNASFILAGQKIRLAAWHNLHLRKLPALVGMVLRVEFLKADDTPRYKTPIYLFWTGPFMVPLEDLCRMYLWRFAIELVLTDLERRIVLDILPDRQKATLTKWLKEPPTGIDLSSLEAAATDLWSHYRDAVVDVFGDKVKIVADRFHVMQNLHEAILKARRQA